MSLPYSRRPYLVGNTPVDVLSRPYIRGQIRRDDITRTFPGLSLPARLAMEIDGVPFVVNLASGLLISDILSDINALITGAGEAREEDGAVTVYSDTVGQGASIRIVPAVGATDASYYLGFPRWPDRLAHVESGDMAWAPPTPRLDDNPLGTGFIATGEKVTADAYNRSLFLLSRNSDILNDALTRELARGLEITVDPALPVWVARTITDAGGDIEQIDLSDIVGIDASYAERIYVGNGHLSRTSPLDDIAKYFAVMRQDLVEIISGGRTVRIAGVTHGQRMAPTPGFPDEYSPPAHPLADVFNWPADDGSQLLGVDCVKTGPVAIDEVRNRTIIRVIGATFITDGVVEGDKAVIAGSTVDDPFNHNGTYRVTAVLDEEQLELGAANPDDRGELNPAVAGAIGQVTVSSGGVFAEGVWLTFEPPIPAGTVFKLVMGASASLSDLPVDYLLLQSVRSFEEVDDLVQEVIRKMKGPLVDSTDDFTASPFAHSIPGGATYLGEPDITMELLHRRTTRQGAYDGQGRAAGSGFMVEVDTRPPRNQVTGPRVPSPGSAVHAGTGAQFLANDVFYAPGAAFTLDDIGRYLIVWGALPWGVEPYSSYMLVDYLDSEMVVVTPEEYAPGPVPVGNLENWTVLEGRFEDWTAAQVWQTVQQNLGKGRWGGVYFEDTDPFSAYMPGHAFAGLREAGVHSGDGSELRHFEITFVGGDEWVNVPFDPVNSGNVRFGIGGSAELRPGGYLRITNSLDNAGWYHITAALGARLALENLDGTLPTFTATGAGEPARGHLYHATFLAHERISNVSLGGTDVARVGHLFHEDGYASDDLLGVVGITWRGESAGIATVLNDPAFASVDRLPDATQGPFSEVVLYAPAFGDRTTFYGDSRAGQTSATLRGNYALDLVGGTWAVDPTKTNSLMRGGMARMVQLGRDPDLTLLRAPTPVALPPASSILFEDYSYLRSMAALVGDNTRPMSQFHGGFMEFAGAICQRDINVWSIYRDTVERGGIYSELSGGFRKSLHPVMISPERYYTNAFKNRSRFGRPGQIAPFDGTSYTAVAVTPPDPANSDSYTSSGFVEWADPGSALLRLFAAADMLIGCQIEISNSMVGNNGIYTIINVFPIDGVSFDRRKVEVLGIKTLNTEPVGGAPPDIVVLGSRWHYGYMDTAVFMMLGTESFHPVGATWVARPVERFPLIGVVGRTVGILTEGGDLDNFADPEPAWPTYGQDFHAPNTLMSLINTTYGQGDGQYGELVTGAAPASAWMAEEPFSSMGWGSFYDHGVPPSDIIPLATGPFVDAAFTRALNPQNFWNSDWVWVENAKLTYLGAARASNRPASGDAAGGVAHMEYRIQGIAGGINLSPGKHYLRSKGQRMLTQNHFGVTVEMEAVAYYLLPSPPNEAALELDIALMADDGTVFGTPQTITLPYVVGAPPFPVATHSVFIGESTLREAGNLALEDIQNFHVRIRIGGITAPNTAFPADVRLRIYKLSVQMDNTNQLSYGNEVRIGHVAAQGFSLLTPARDYVTVGPAEADLFVPHGFASEVPLMPDGLYTDYVLPVDPPGRALIVGNYEGVQRLGLVPARDLIEFNKGQDYAALRFISKWTDPWQYVQDAVAGYPTGVGSDEYTRGLLPPSRVGFIVPVRPPHGSRLTEIDLSMSFQPQFYTDQGADAVQLRIWGDREPYYSSNSDIVGVRVRVCRQHLFRDTDVLAHGVANTQRVSREFTNDPAAGTLVPGVQAPVNVDHSDPWDPAGLEHQREGQHEVLFQTYMEVDTDGVLTDGALTSNEVGSIYPGSFTKLDHPIGFELFNRRKYFMLTEHGGQDPNSGAVGGAVPWWNDDPAVFTIDRRQFSYYVIIDAWGRGQSDFLSGDVDPVPVNPGDPGLDEFTGSGLFSPWYRLAAVGTHKPNIPASAEVTWLEAVASGAASPDLYKYLRQNPTMKFRGLRYGYEWSRILPG